MQDHVILLHGLFRTKISMGHLSLVLKKHGYSTSNIQYRSIRQTISQHALRVRNHILNKIPPGSRISFVGHSLGCIVTRKLVVEHYSELHARGYRFGKAVMLGPPNRGADIAKRLRAIPFFEILLGPSFVELSELDLAGGSDKIEVGIIAGGRGNSRGYSPLLGGDNDGIVLVEETKLANSKDWILVRGLHTILPYYPCVIKQVLHFLKEGTFEHSK